MKEENLGSQIERQVNKLVSKGWTRDTIEKRLGYSENYIDQTISRGGSKKFLRLLQDLETQPVLYNTTQDEPKQQSFLDKRRASKLNDVVEGVPMG